MYAPPCLASQADHNHHNGCSKADVTISRVRARPHRQLPASRVEPAHSVGMETPLPVVEKAFQAKNLSDNAMLNVATPCFVFSVFSHVLDFVKSFFVTPPHHHHRTDVRYFQTSKRGSSAHQTRNT